MKLKLTRGPAALIVLLLASSAVAEQGAANKKSDRVVVPADGAVDYRLVVHPDYVTNLYFSDNVERAWNSNQNAFEVTGKGSVLHIRALTAEKVDGNIAVVAGSLKVGIHISVGAKDDAVFQVFFERSDQTSEVDAEIERRVGILRKQDAEKLQAHIARARQAYSTELVAEVSRGVTVHPLRRLGRSDSHVIVRLEKVVYVGSLGHLVFDIQNRSGRVVSLDNAVVTGNRQPLTRGFVLTGKTASDRALADGHHVNAVVQFDRDPKLKAVSLTLGSGDSDGIHIADVKLP